MLLDDLIDIGIYGGFKQDTRVQYRCIDYCQLPVFISQNFPLAKNRNINQVDLIAHPQVVVKSSYKTSPNTGIVKDGLQWYVSSHSTKKSLISSGLGWGRLPLHEVEQEVKKQTLIKLNNPPPIELPVYVAKLKNKVLGPVGMMVWHFFDDYK